MKLFDYFWMGQISTSALYREGDGTCALTPIQDFYEISMGKKRARFCLRIAWPKLMRLAMSHPAREFMAGIASEIWTGRQRIFGLRAGWLYMNITAQDGRVWRWRRKLMSDVRW